MEKRCPECCFSHVAALRIEPSAIHGLGVFARCDIAAGVRFGPYGGVRVPVDQYDNLCVCGNLDPCLCFSYDFGVSSNLGQLDLSFSKFCRPNSVFTTNVVKLWRQMFNFIETTLRSNRTVTFGGFTQKPNCTELAKTCPNSKLKGLQFAITLNRFRGCFIQIEIGGRVAFVIKAGDESTSNWMRFVNCARYSRPRCIVKGGPLCSQKTSTRGTLCFWTKLKHLNRRCNPNRRCTTFALAVFMVTPQWCVVKRRSSTNIF